MSEWKRAILYLLRKKSRMILLTVLLFVMSCFILAGLSLKSSADREEERLQQSLGTGFTLRADMENEMYYEDYYEEYENGERWSGKVYAGPMITDEMIGKILSIDGVTDYRITLSDLVYADLNLKPGMWAVFEATPIITEEEAEIYRKETRVIPCRKGEMDPNFRSGALTISVGRNIQEGDRFKAVISEYLAEKNNLALGDTITVEDKVGMVYKSDEPLKTLGKPVTLEIVGLFQMNFEQAASKYTSEDGYIENVIYTDLDTHTILRTNTGEAKFDNQHWEVTFFAEDSGKLDDIVQQIKEGDDFDLEAILVSLDDSAYKASAKPFWQISLFSSIILAVGIAGIGMILCLVMNLWVKGRKHEMGILLSIGIGKRKIVGQMLAECLMVSCVALLFSILLSGTMIDACAHAAEQITAPKSREESYRVEPASSLAPIPVAVKKSSDEIKLDHGVSMNILLLVVVIVWGLSSVSVLLASVQILDIDPKGLLQSM